MTAALALDAGRQLCSRPAARISTFAECRGVLPVRLTGVHLPGSGFELGGRRIGPVSLGFGRQGVDPEAVCSGDAESVVIDVHVETRIDARGSATLLGPYVAVGAGFGALVIQWGVISAGGTFLLFHAAQLRLPALEVVPVRDLGRLALRATVDLTDSRGGPLRGVVPADQIRWTLVQRPVTARLIASA